MALDKRFLSIDDLTHMPVPLWSVEGLFEVNSLTMLSGPPGNYKSFLVLDWMLCCACGMKWQGRSTTPARVLYVLGEGKASLLKRIKAWMDHHHPTPDQSNLIMENFRISFEVPQMAMKSSVDNMLSQLEAEQYHPTLIVIDTFARSFVGLDENAQKDVGLWVEQADRLRQLGYTVIFLHHTKKNTEFGLQYRGSSAILGAMDTAMTLSKDQSGKIKLSVVKQKDHEEGAPIYMVAKSANGTEGSCVLLPTIKKDIVLPEYAGGADTNEVNQVASDLILDNDFDSDSKRAQELMTRFGLGFEAAKKRIARARGLNMDEVTS